ncbi:MAG: KpsF/GutQ family sugar-phosphate isomerase [Gammaproteobacteria bacterium]|nr:KpsF/GutQ family sugar-phosphate isomerase [Gammaproteobacteria bacterium]
MPEFTTDFCASGRRVLAIEARAVAELEDRIDERFAAACRLMLDCRGRVVVIGMGKSGHIGGKLAATLASTGTPAFFVHPGEAGHGDLGMITAQDVVLALSNSGETAEILTLLPVIKRLGVPLISLTGRPHSTLAQAAEVSLDATVGEEACPLGLAPTASTTAALAFGDALAVALLEARGFTAEDFAFSHPAGALGKRLLLRVADLMHKDEALPRVTLDTGIVDALREITGKRLGMTTVLDAEGRLAGLFTDGDLRRALEARLDVHGLSMAEVMTRHPKTIGAEELAAEALRQMEEYKITCLVVADGERRPVGIVHLHDILKEGV